MALFKRLCGPHMPVMVLSLLAVSILSLVPAAEAGEGSPVPASEGPVEPAGEVSTDQAAVPSDNPGAAEAPEVDEQSAKSSDVADASGAVAKIEQEWQEYVLEGGRLRITVSDLRGAIKEIALLDVAPQELPTWRGGFGKDTDRTVPLPVISDTFNPVELRQGMEYPFVALTDMTNYVWKVNGLQEATKSGWTMEQTDAASIKATASSDIFDFGIAYRIDPELPRVHVRLSFKNVSGQTESLTPQVRALNGIWQDDTAGDAYDIRAFAHFGGAEENDLETYHFPAVGAREPDFTTDIQEQSPDYVGLKSRFFATWMTPGEARIIKPGASSDGPIDLENFGQVAKIGGILSGFTERRIGKDPAFPQDFMQAAIDVYWQAPTGAALQLQPNETLVIDYSITATDVSKKNLADAGFLQIEKEIEYTDAWYHFFRPLANTLNWLLSMLTGITGSAGVAILLVTLLVKLVLYWPTYKQRTSMLKMQKIAPEMKRIQDQYKNDRQTAAMKTMELYKKHKVNPAGGCLPILIQMPIFIAL